MNNWQPISTAPENEYVLVWHPSFYGVRRAKFDTDKVYVKSNSFSHVWVGFYCDDDGWYTSVLDPAPLYWQPLPEPPEL